MLIKIKALMKSVEYCKMAVKAVKYAREYIDSRDDHVENSQLQDVLKTLNQAFKDDPQAIHALICNRVPCNQNLADHPTIQVLVNKGALKGGYNVGTLGMINGVLEAAGIGKVAVMFSDRDDDGVSTIEGFCEYVVPTYRDFIKSPAHPRSIILDP